MAAGEHHRSVRVNIRLDLSLSSAGELALEHRHLAAEALRAQSGSMQAREAERPLRDPGARTLHAPADPASHRPEVVAPVRPRPYLVPVDHQPEAAGPSQETRREQGEVGERGGVDNVVAASPARQMGKHAEAEHQRRADPPPARARVEAEPRSDRQHEHARHARIGPARPLAQRQVRHLVPLRAQPLGEAAVPALAAAHREREQAVVDEAHAHGAQPITAAADTTREAP